MSTVIIEPMKIECVGEGCGAEADGGITRQRHGGTMRVILPPDWIYKAEESKGHVVLSFYCPECSPQTLRKRHEAASGSG